MAKSNNKKLIDCGEHMLVAMDECSQLFLDVDELLKDPEKVQEKSLEVHKYYVDFVRCATETLAAIDKKTDETNKLVKKMSKELSKKE